MDAAVGAAGGGGGSSSGLVLAVHGEGGEDEARWTDVGTEQMLKIAVRLLQFSRSIGEQKFNRHGFWKDLFRCLESEAKLARSPDCCKARYRSVLKYYRRNRGTVVGTDYRFAESLEKVIPLDDELKPTLTPTKKKINASKKRPSTDAADGIEDKLPAAKRAAAPVDDANKQPSTDAADGIQDQQPATKRATAPLDDANKQPSADAADGIGDKLPAAKRAAPVDDANNRPSTDAADGIEDEQPAAKRAARVDDHATDDMFATVRQLASDMQAQQARFEAWQAQDDAWKGRMTTLIQSLLNLHNPPASPVSLDPLFPGADDFIIPQFP